MLSPYPTFQRANMSSLMLPMNFMTALWRTAQRRGRGGLDKRANDLRGNQETNARITQPEGWWGSVLHLGVGALLGQSVLEDVEGGEVEQRVVDALVQEEL